jgi:alanyl-tRNA synthetase
MKSERLYYHNAYLTEFNSPVLAHLRQDNRPAIVLAHSAFYPTSGGQPHDLGTLNDQPVLDVLAQDEMVVHILSGDLPTDTAIVHGRVNWERRFDHMVHHTGQHILTRAFIETCGAETVGFHLSENSVTIDLDQTALSDDAVSAAEALANEIIIGNLPVRAWFPEPDELRELSLRKVSEKVTGAVRVVDIGGFDITACGGTHVAQTGEIGLIKLIRADRKGDKLRVEFLCGQRARADYQWKNKLLLELSATLTRGIGDIPDAFARLEAENKALQKDLRQTKGRLLSYEAEQWWQTAYAQQSSNEALPVVICQRMETNDKNDLQQMANELMTRPRTVALLGMAGEQAHLLFARTDDVPDLDLVGILKSALSLLETQRGGGRPMLAQGGGVAASPAQIERALQHALTLIQDQFASSG